MIKSRYFIALLLDNNTTKLIEECKQSIFQKFGCSSTLKSKAHITLVSPFETSEDNANKLSTIVQNIAHNLNQFHLLTNGWNNFDQRTIFLEVVKNAYLEYIYQMFSGIMPKEIMKKSQPEFYPHITVANRDINSNDYDSIWKLVNNISTPKSVIIDSIVFYKFINHLWDSTLTFKFGNKINEIY